MKIIFLDIDGVANSTSSFMARSSMSWKHNEDSFRIDIMQRFKNRVGDFPYGVKITFDTINPVSVDLINRVLAKDEGVRIVLSSSHRSFFANDETGIAYGSDEHLELLKMYLFLLGFNCLNRFEGIIPRLFCERGKECAEWLEQNPGWTHAVAIDDGSDFKNNQVRLVRTDAKHGFSCDEYFKVCEILEIKESPIIV